MVIFDFKCGPKDAASNQKEENELKFLKTTAHEGVIGN
jgi:hypothetical protein